MGFGDAPSRALKRLGWLALSLLLLAPLAHAPIAHAQAASTDDELRAFVERGVEEYAAGRWDEARALFEQAHRLRPTARTARGIGMAAFNQRDYVGAVTFLALALSSTEQPLTDTQRTQATDLRSRALSFVGRFRFDVTRPEARIEVRGAPTVSGAECVLPLGSHVVRTHAPGFLPTERILEVHGGEQQRILLTLLPLPKIPVAPPRERKRLTVWGWSLLGVGGASAIAALAVHLRANGEYDDLARHCKTTRCFPENTDTAKIDRLDHAAMGLWIGGAAAGVAATALLTTSWLRSREHGSDKLQVAVSGRGVQLRLSY